MHYEALAERMQGRRASSNGGYPPFPDNFLFGVACADHQCEAFDPAYPLDVWDWWEQRGEVPQPREKAIDFWNRFEEYVDLAAELGCTAFRFSIAWARVEPKPGVYDPAVLDHYAQLAHTVRRRGLEPIVTLCHYTWPLHLQWAGGLIGPGFPESFVRYVEQVRDALAPYVRFWLTFNEPNELVPSHSQLVLRFPPSAPVWLGFREQVREMEMLIRNIFLAQRDARAVLHSGPFGERAMVSLNTDIHGVPILLRRLLNTWVTGHFPSARNVRTLLGAQLAASSAESIENGLNRLFRTLVLLFDGDWCELGAFGRLPERLCPASCVNQIDYLAFDYYYGVRRLWELGKFQASIDGHFERAPVYAPGLYDTLVYFDRLFKQAYPPAGKPVFIMENGLVDQIATFKRRGEEPPLGAQDPATYLQDHVRQVQRARAAGVDVIGYCVWSLTSNREWGLRYGPGTDFGLYTLDLDRDPGLHDPTRPLDLRPTPALEAYRQIIAQRGVSAP
jgi:beta-glucosidase/6-phospho-beta-glucosidase/beta-galactosidase